MISFKKIVPAISYSLCIVALVGGIVFFHNRVRVLWKEEGERQVLLQKLPAETIQTSILKKQLDAALVRMKSIDATVPSEDGLVGVIVAISRAAIDAGISAQVPVVGAKIIDDDAPSDDLFSDVRIHIIASGDPAALAAFLYRVEHLPYLLRVVHLKIDTIQQSSVASFTGPTQNNPQDLVPVLGSSLQAELAIVTKKKDTVLIPPKP